MTIKMTKNNKKRLDVNKQRKNMSSLNKLYVVLIDKQTTELWNCRLMTIKTKCDNRRQSLIRRSRSTLDDGGPPLSITFFVLVYLNQEKYIGLMYFPPKTSLDYNPLQPIYPSKQGNNPKKAPPVHLEKEQREEEVKKK